MSIHPLLAAAPDLLGSLGEALRIIMMFGFLAGTIAVISGGLAIRRGEAESGKMGIMAGIVIAAAPAIMYAIYHIFGLGTAAIVFK